ncbi:zf-HC2 domain-containing protein [candidate division KSB1 bacterium]|nr:zf-HC2 domain-containing protein [candidate division KSB1 bacterium]
MKSIFHPRKKISLYLDQRLSPEEVQKLEEHLSVCKSCRRLLQNMSTMRAVLREKPSVSVRKDFVSRVIAGHRRQQADEAFWIGFESVPRLLPQLAFVLVVVLALLWSWPQLEITTPEAVDDQIARVSVLDEREMISNLTTYDEALRFALNGTYENMEGDRK